MVFGEFTSSEVMFPNLYLALVYSLYFYYAALFYYPLSNPL